jgi:hypothetical protein
MQKLTVDAGAFGPEGFYPSEKLTFRGRKLIEMPHHEHGDRIKLSLYECPGGYRILLRLDIGLLDESGCIVFVPPRDQNARYLLSEKEVRERFEYLLLAANRPLERDLDEEPKETLSVQSTPVEPPVGLAKTMSARRSKTAL